MAYDETPGAPFATDAVGEVKPQASTRIGRRGNVGRGNYCPAIVVMDMLVQQTDGL